MIEVKEIKSKKELKKFVKFPFELYRNNPYWVPPIISEELESFDRKKNPVFEHAEARFFLAYSEGKIVGRVAAIINRIEVDQQKVRKMRFGWFDFTDDIDVSRALLGQVEKIGREEKLDFMEGPVGFSNMDKVGILTEGYDQLGTMVTWYNHPYYVDHMTELGFSPENRFLESYFYTKDAKIDKYQRMAQVIARRYELTPVVFKSTKEVMPYVNEIFELFNTSYSKLASYVPISDKQIEYFKNKYIRFINPDFIKVILDKNKKIIAFAITMPSFARALQKANGRLFPFGIFHLLRARKQSKESIFYLIGIDPGYQKKGVTAIVFDLFHEAFKRHGVTKGIITPELEENKDIQLIWEKFNPVHNKRRATFRKDLAH
jgi:hypothetical protein